MVFKKTEQAVVNWIQRAEAKDTGGLLWTRHEVLGLWLLYKDKQSTASYKVSVN